MGKRRRAWMLICRGMSIITIMMKITIILMTMKTVIIPMIITTTMKVTIMTIAMKHITIPMNWQN